MALPACITRPASVCVDEVDLGQPAVAAEDVGEALVGREDDRGVREVAEPGDAADRGPLRAVHDQERPARPLHHHPEIAGGADLAGRRRQRQRVSDRARTRIMARPSSRYPAIQAASASVRSGRQGGIAVPAGRRGSPRPPPRANGRPAPRDGCRGRGRRPASARGRSRSPAATRCASSAARPSGSPPASAGAARSSSASAPSRMQAPRDAARRRPRAIQSTGTGSIARPPGR